MLQCLEGLDHAHRQNLVHGDLKPQNILLHVKDRKRVARITDFGLAMQLETTGWSGMTTTGKSWADYHFTPRERVLGLHKGDARSDQWSLAAVFYHMLSGTFPRDFDGRDPIAAILHSETVPLRERNPKIPQPVASVIDRALSSSPEKRFRDVAQLKAHMKRAFDQVRG
jgi:serine/threonine protein kinase